MLLLKLPFSAFVQLTKNWITSPNIRLYQLQWDNYHHGIHKTLYFQNEIINQSCLWDWSKGKYLQDDSQSCLFSRGVGVFDLIFLRHFLTKMRSFCAHQKGNFLNFSKLTLLLSLDHSWCPQWPIKCYRAFFLGHPVGTMPISPNPSPSPNQTCFFGLAIEEISFVMNDESETNRKG